jgi:hypothetical protein
MGKLNYQNLKLKRNYNCMRSVVLDVFVISFVSRLRTLTDVSVKPCSVTHPTNEPSNYTNLILIIY